MRSDLRILLMLMAIGIFSNSGGAQDDSASRQQVKALVQKLDADSFNERERAIAELKEMGKPIVPYLIAARKTAVSEEVRSRLDSLLQLHTLSPIAVLRGHQDRIMGVDFAPSGDKLVSVSLDKTVRVWDLATQKSIYKSAPMKTPLETAIFTPDGKQMVVCGGNLRGGRYEFSLRNAVDGETIHSFVGHKGRVNRLRLSPNGKLLASTGIDKTIQIWNVSTGKNLAKIRGHKHHVYGVSFHPDGNRIASSGRDHSVRLWDVSTGKQMQHFKGHTDQVIDVEFSPDGKHLASACDDKTIRFWDVSTGKELRRFIGHGPDIRDLCFSPDSRILASASYDKTVKLWEVSTGVCIATLKHKDVARAVTFSPDGEKLASACGDHTLCIWDVSTIIDVKTNAHSPGETKEHKFQAGTLVCNVGLKRGEGTVKLYQGKKLVWRIGGLNNPEFAEQLPNGNVLIAEYGYEPRPEKLQVTERTPENRIVWTHVAYEPIACFRLEDGRTIVAAEREVYVVDQKGKQSKVLYESPRNLIRGASLLPDGTIGFFRTNYDISLLVEIDIEGNVVRQTEIENDGTGSFATLPNGHLLLPMTFDNKVIELDVNRRPVGVFAEDLVRPCGVQRLPGGNIAVTWKEGVTTFDTKGKKIGQQEFSGKINSTRIYFPSKFSVKSDSAIADFKSLDKDSALALQYLLELGATIDESKAKGLVTEVDLFNFYPLRSLVRDESLKVIGLFPTLERLNLGNAKISDQGMAHLKTLTDLKSLNLDDTGVTDQGLGKLAPIQSLAAVSLVNVPISDDGLRSLVQSNPKLEYLNLAGTKVTDTGLAVLFGLENLRSVVLPHETSDLGITTVAKISSLESIAVRSKRLTANGIKSLKNLSQLQSLELRKTKLTDEAMESIITFDGLRYLNLSGSKRLSSAGLSKLAKLRKLRILKLDDCRVDDDAIKQISSLGYLEELFLQSTEITDKGLKHLGNTITLKHLYLFGTKVSGRAISNLKLVELPYCRVVKRDRG